VPAVEVAAELIKNAPLRYTLYPTTPTLSVELSQERFIWLVETADALKLAGADGGVVSGIVLVAVVVAVVVYTVLVEFVEVVVAVYVYAGVPPPPPPPPPPDDCETVVAGCVMAVTTEVVAATDEVAVACEVKAGDVELPVVAGVLV
jgi:hypothetical protein